MQFESVRFIEYNIRGVNVLFSIGANKVLYNRKIDRTWIQSICEKRIVYDNKWNRVS